MRNAKFNIIIMMWMQCINDGSKTSSRVSNTHARTYETQARGHTHTNRNTLLPFQVFLTILFIQWIMQRGGCANNDFGCERSILFDTFCSDSFVKLRDFASPQMSHWEIWEIRKITKSQKVRKEEATITEMFLSFVTRHYLDWIGVDEDIIWIKWASACLSVSFQSTFREKKSDKGNLRVRKEDKEVAGESEALWENEPKHWSCNKESSSALKLQPFFIKHKRRHATY